ncbi:MAG: hypothetical protein WAZ18_01675 [Alphaproteobacteria bacterium]
MKTTLSAVLILTLAMPLSWAAIEHEIDTMTTFAVMLGRSIGCAHDTDTSAQKIGTWLDRHFPPKSSDQKTYLPIFMQGVSMNMKAQMAGESPDSCSKVKAFFQSPEFLRVVRQ